MNELELIIPGLNEVPDDALRRCRRLSAMLARGRRVAAPRGVEAALCAAAGLADDAVQQWPAAPVSALGEGLGVDGWLCAVEPVPLALYTDHVTLGAVSALAITADEAEALAHALQRLWGEDDLRLQVATPERWYLDGPGAATLGAGHPAAASLAGERLDTLLERAPDRRLAGLITEAQMLFHEHAVNRARDADGRVQVGGVWLSGGGQLPSSVPRPTRRVAGSHAFARGLARLAGQPVVKTPRCFEALRAGDLPLALLLPAPASHADGVDAGLAALERDWIAGAWRALATGRLRRLGWQDAAGTGGHLGPVRRWQLWRRTPARGNAPRARDA